MYRVGLYDVSVQCFQSSWGSQLWRKCVRVAINQARPPKKLKVVAAHSQASFPRSIALPQLRSPCTSLTKKHLAYCLLNESRFRTGDWPTLRSTSPHKSTPMLGVPDAHGAAGRAVLKWKVVRRGPVNEVVRRWNLDAAKTSTRSFHTGRSRL